MEMELALRLRGTKPSLSRVLLFSSLNVMVLLRAQWLDWYARSHTRPVCGLEALSSLSPRTCFSLSLQVLALPSDSYEL